MFTEGGVGELSLLESQCFQDTIGSLPTSLADHFQTLYTVYTPLYTVAPHPLFYGHVPPVKIPRNFLPLRGILYTYAIMYVL